MIAGDSPMIFGDFDNLVITGFRIDGLEIDLDRIILGRDASVDWDDLGFVSVQDVVVVSE